MTGAGAVLIAMIQAGAVHALTTDSVTFIRVNQVGSLSGAPNVAVACSLARVTTTAAALRSSRCRGAGRVARTEAAG